MGPLPNAASNAPTYPWIAVSRATSVASGRFILVVAVIGPNATDSRSRKCPSQPSFGVQATSSKVGARTGSGVRFSPIERGSPSPHDSAGLWQVAHDIVREPDRIGSKNSCWPSLFFASLYGLSFGKGIAVGRR